MAHPDRWMPLKILAARKGTDKRGTFVVQYETRFVGRTEAAWVAATKVGRVLIAEFWESYEAHSGRSQKDWLEGRKLSRSAVDSLGLEKNCKSLEDKGSARPNRKKRTGGKHGENEDDLPEWFPALTHH
ncbi:hypothetical protein K4K58_001908 [Colletotrichum sp. SAR11_239]|nr:hypothetical protein K4K58_001908 [Colletotrichum sp. SAR11_239]